MGEIFKLFGSIGVDTSDAEKGIDEVTGKAKKSGKGIFGAFTKAAKGIGKIAAGIGIFALVNKGMQLVTNSVGRAISRVDALNQFPKVLQQMGYGADEAKNATDKLVKGIDGLPTTLDGITGDVQRLVNVFQDVDLAAESAIGLNNAFLASGASTADAERGLDQYIKMLSTGKVNMDSWQTLQETMPYALQETAEAFNFTGKTAQNDFYEALKNGDITMDEFNNKIIELSEGQNGFADVAIEATKGIGTSWGNIQTAIANGVAKSIQAFDDFLESKGLGGISGVLDLIKATVGNAFDKVNEVIPVALEWFGALYTKISESTAWQTLREVVESVVGAIQDLWSNLNDNAILGIVKDMLTDLFDALLEIDFKRITDDVVEFLDNWSPLIAGIVAGIAVFELITIAIGIWTTVTTIATGVGMAFGAAIAFITSPIGIVIIAIGLLVAAGVLLYKNWDTVKTFMTRVFNGIKDIAVAVFNSLKVFFTTVFNAMKSVIMNVWNSIKSFLTGIFNSLKSMATSVWNGIKSTITSVVNGISSTISSVFNGIKNTASTIFNAVRDAMTKPVETAKNTIKGIIDAVKGFFSGMKLSFPKITMPKLPKFSLKGKFSLAPPSVPKLGIDWFADGGILEKATAFGMNGNNVMVGGEAGREAVLPLNKETLGGIGDGIAATMNWGNDQIVALLESIKDQLVELLSKNETVILQIDGKTFAQVTSDYTSEEGGMRIRRVERGLA